MITLMANEEGRTDSDVLTARERAFVEAYLLTANGAKAAQAAGYSSRSAKVRAVRLLNRRRVAAAISHALQARAERVGIDADRVLAELEELAFSNLDHYEIDAIAGTVRVKPDAPQRAMRAIASIRHRIIPAGRSVLFSNRLVHASRWNFVASRRCLPASLIRRTIPRNEPRCSKQLTPGRGLPVPPTRTRLPTPVSSAGSAPDVPTETTL
jgi:Terminase small subunit